MAKLELAGAASLAARNRPWSVRLEFVSPKTGAVEFWYATGRGLSESVEMGGGDNGTVPQTLLGTFDDFRAGVHEKLGRGYQYVNAPYQRMRPENLAKVTLTGLVVPSSSVYAPGPPGPGTQVPAPPPPAPGGGIAAPAVSPKIVTLAQQALGSPYDLIRSFRVKRLPASGVPSVIMMEALDVLGGVLLLMQVQEAVSFARDHVLDIQW